MILYPAIDIMDGQAVRLVEGVFEDATTYHADPVDAAKSWVDAGARFLHVVDLDGARSGEPKSLEHLKRIVRDRRLPPHQIAAEFEIEAFAAFEAMRSDFHSAVTSHAMRLGLKPG